MHSQPAHPTYEFGDFELDSLRRVLVSRADGQTVDVTGRAMEALLFLVQRPGQLVEKKALFEALWPNVVVEEGNLTQTIHTLRRALGEKSGEHRYIATVQGRGYRFVAEVRTRIAQLTAAAATETSTATESPAPRRPRAALITVAVSLAALVAAAVFFWRDRGQPVAQAVSTPRSIAVLPFVDMSAEQNQAHFADGLSEEILNMLAQSDDLRVIARTSSFSFKGQSVDIGTIAKRLDVTHVLEGSVRKSGERIRITAQLIDTSNSAHLWSETFDRDIDDIFGVQSEIATAVADSLQVTLRRTGPRRAETHDTQAYEHYLHGRHLFNRRAEGDLMQAKAHFEKAVQIDPEFGRAWAGLAGVYLVSHYDGPAIPDHVAQWKIASERAVALAPELAEAHVRAAQYLWHAGSTEAGNEHFDRATALDPADPLLMAVSASYIFGRGRFEEGLALQRRVVATDPLSATARGNLGVMLMVTDQLAEAQAQLERARELSPDSLLSNTSVADVLMLQGRTEEALRIIPRIPEGFLRHQRLAIAHHALGNTAEADAALARLLALAEKPDSNSEIAVAVAEVFAARQDRDRAFEWIERAFQRSSNQPGVPRWGLHENLRMAPFLKPLHTDPRWEKFLARPE